MKKIMIIACMLAQALVASAQWVPVAVNTNVTPSRANLPIDFGTFVSNGLVTNVVNVYAATNRATVSNRMIYAYWDTNVLRSIAGLTNALSGTNVQSIYANTNRAWWSNGTINVSWETNPVPTSLTNVMLLAGSTNTAYASNRIGYVVYSTNAISPWTPSTNWTDTNALLLYTFSATNQTITDMSGHGNDGWAYFPGSFSGAMFTNNAYRVSPVHENCVHAYRTNLLYGVPSFTMAMWVNLYKPLRAATPTASGKVLWQGSTLNGLNEPLSTNGSTLCMIDANTLYWHHQGLVYLDAKSTTNHATYMPTGVWHRLVLTYDKTGVSGHSNADVKIWINGTNCLTGTSTNKESGQLFMDTERFSFGGLISGDGITYPSSVMDALIDDCALYPYAWTYSNVTSDYATGRSN